MLSSFPTSYSQSSGFMLVLPNQSRWNCPDQGSSLPPSLPYSLSPSLSSRAAIEYLLALHGVREVTHCPHLPPAPGCFMDSSWVKACPLVEGRRGAGVEYGGVGSTLSWSKDAWLLLCLTGAWDRALFSYLHLFPQY